MNMNRNQSEVTFTWIMKIVAHKQLKWLQDRSDVIVMVPAAASDQRYRTQKKGSKLMAPGYQYLELALWLLN
jgi:hypothetical protein